MDIKIDILNTRVVKKDRHVIGNENESNVTTMRFTFPEEVQVQGLSPYIEFEAGGKKYQDLILDNEYRLKSDIMQARRVECQVVFRDDFDHEVWKSNIFDFRVGHSINARESDSTDIPGTIITELIEIRRQLATKQPRLQVGTNISIIPNTDGTETISAGDGLGVSDGLVTTEEFEGHTENESVHITHLATNQFHETEPISSYPNGKSFMQTEPTVHNQVWRFVTGVVETSRDGQQGNQTLRAHDREEILTRNAFEGEWSDWRRIPQTSLGVVFGSQRDAPLVVNTVDAIRTESLNLLLTSANNNITMTSATSTNITAGNALNLNGDSVRSATMRDETTTTAANLNISTGTTAQIRRSSSAERYKLNINRGVDIRYAEKLLEVEPATWFDRNNTEAFSTLLTRQFSGEKVDLNEAGIEMVERIGGLVAEDVEKAGLDIYVSYSGDGKTVEGVAYDRLWTLLIPIVRDQRSKIKSLEARLGKLEQKKVGVWTKLKSAIKTMQRGDETCQETEQRT